MNNPHAKSCDQCQVIICHPMLLVLPAKSRVQNGFEQGDLARDYDNQVLLAAQLRCSCHEDLTAGNGDSAADLSFLSPPVRKAIHDKLQINGKAIPVINPETINRGEHLIFVTGFDTKVFRQWLAMDLLTVREFYDYVDMNIISVEEVFIGREVMSKA